MAHSARQSPGESTAGGGPGPHDQDQQCEGGDQLDHVQTFRSSDRRPDAGEARGNGKTRQSPYVGQNHCIPRTGSKAKCSTACTAFHRYGRSEVVRTFPLLRRPVPRPAVGKEAQAVRARRRQERGFRSRRNESRSVVLGRRAGTIRWLRLVFRTRLDARFPELFELAEAPQGHAAGERLFGERRGRRAGTRLPRRGPRRGGTVLPTPWTGPSSRAGSAPRPTPTGSARSGPSRRCMRTAGEPGPRRRVRRVMGPPPGATGSMGPGCAAAIPGRCRPAARPGRQSAEHRPGARSGLTR